MRLTINHNGFHGYHTVSCNVGAADNYGDGQMGYEISARVAHRLNSEICGVDSCQCGEGVADQISGDGTRWAIVIPESDAGQPDIDMHGRYGQR